MKLIRLAWRQLRRDLKAGDIRILIAALMLAVIAVTAVGFITDRANRALLIEANRLMGGDAVLRADKPITGVIRDASAASALRHTDEIELDSMVRVGTGDDAQLRLGELHALGAGFPLRGSFRLVDAGGVERDAARRPDRGTVWMSRAGAVALGARIGDAIAVGSTTLRLDAIVLKEPNAALDYFNVAPRVFLNAGDLPATGLVQEGSRVGYRLMVVGDSRTVERFVAIANANIGRGQRLETAGQTNPEIRSALDRAGRFLGLAALVSVVLATVAVAMAARRHSERHLSGAAVMRCLGASQRMLVGIHVGEMVLLGLIASVLGVAIAFALQWAVADWLAQLLKLSIPAAGWMPALQGLCVGMVVLLAFATPPVLALRRVSALRVIRRDLDATEPSAWLVTLAGFTGMAALLWWKAGSATLGGAMLLGIAATLAVLALLAWMLIVIVRRLRPRLRGSLRYGLANVSRRPGTSIAQVSALGLGLMALLLLGFVRTDLLDRWQHSLAQDAPNRFLINVQSDQVRPVTDFISAQHLPAPVLFPMVRGRLLTRNGTPVTAKTVKRDGDSGDDDAAPSRRADREFNLSTATTLRADNTIVAGRLWPPTRLRTPQISVEQRFADSLGWKLGDRIAFDIAGQRFEAPITSLRSVDWESFRPNFFVVASPGALDGYPASYVTAVKVPPGNTRFTATLVEHFPNVSVIDIEAVLQQVRATGDQVSKVVQVVFWFSLAAGVLVLLAAISASQDERLLEGGVMRVLGGSRRQLRLAQASEFAAIGLLSGLVAAIAASILSGVVAQRVFDLPWTPNWKLAVFGGAIGMLAALVAGLVATRRVVDVPPSVVLRELQG
ncbi:MAG: permease [Xanthomonadaceae bacterium]|nr:permease [Xanthomonadaceae bacterium]